jgi:predicted transcriptional regulator
VYRARVAESVVRRSMLARLTDYFFGGDTSALVSHLAGGEAVGERDLEEVRRLVEDRESQEDDNG